jgi:hypothetical protein
LAGVDEVRESEIKRVVPSIIPKDQWTNTSLTIRSNIEAVLKTLPHMISGRDQIIEVIKIYSAIL